MYGSKQTHFLYKLGRDEGQKEKEQKFRHKKMNVKGVQNDIRQGNEMLCSSLFSCIEHSRNTALWSANKQKARPKSFLPQTLFY